MSKKLIAAALALSMAAWLFPQAAFAQKADNGLREAQGPALVQTEAKSDVKKPAKPTITVATSPSAGKLKVKVRKVKGAAGYQYRIRTNSAGATNKTKTTNARWCVFKKARQGARYHVRVRAYSLIGGKKVWGAWSSSKAVNVQWKVKWYEQGGYVKCRKSNGKLARGLCTIDGKTYLFDKYNHQKTGWQKFGGAVRFFKIANGAGGYMAKNRVVNGIELGADGAARETPSNSEEISIMRKAQKLAEKLTVPTQSKEEKLSKGFDYLRNDCEEKLTRDFSYYAGWHRAFALDVFSHKTGSCWSYGAALAYYANAIGFKSCVIVSSGGHGWAQIGGKVYDAEWTKHQKHNIYALPYSESGKDGIPDYASNCNYTVRISPNRTPW